MSFDNSDSKADQSASAKDDFNAKVVKVSEWNEQYKKLAKTSFTFPEKVKLAVYKPLNLVRWVKAALKMATDPSLQQQLSEQSPDGSLGLYQDEQKSSYINGVFYNESFKKIYNAVSDQNLRKKSMAVSAQAFENCQDYKNKTSLRPM